MSHPPEPLLSHNEESMTEHRKSHPLETSLSSRELAERLFNSIPRPAFDSKLSKELKDYLDRDLVKNTAINSFTALIDAWVRVREVAAHAAAIQVALQIFREQYQAAMMDTGGDREAATYCGLQAIEKITPADVHKGGTHGQAQAPSAAASANYEPGGADEA